MTDGITKTSHRAHKNLASEWIDPGGVLPATEPIWLRLSKGYALELPGNISARWLAELLQCLG